MFSNWVMNFKIARSLFLLSGLVLSANAFAAPERSTPLAAPQAENKNQLATKTEWASGLKEPQGMALHGAFNQNVVLADYGAGKILHYSREGKLLGTLAEGLKSPSQIVVGSKWIRSNLASQEMVQTPVIFVSERKANRIIAIDKDGKITPLGESIEELLGLAFGATGELFTIAHTTSKIYRFDGEKWNLVFAAPLEDGDDKRYGYRCLAFDGGAFLMSDEVGEEVLLLTPGGRIASWAKGIGDPSGITIGYDGATYVCDESDGGRLWRINNIGEKTLVAEGLGRPRGVLFLDAETALVSDRNGKVWKLVWP